MDKLDKNQIFSQMQTSPCLSHFSPAVLEEISELCQIKHFGKGETLHKRGDDASAYYGLLEGRIRASAVSAQGKALSLYIFNAGDWFGEISLLDGIARTHDAEILEKATVLMMPADVFERYVLNDAESIRRVAVGVCARLRLAMQYIEETATLPLENRLASRLLQLYPNTQKVSQQELAHMLGVSRQSVSKLLVGWQDAQWISTEYNGIQILDLNALESLGRLDSVPTAPKS